MSDIGEIAAWLRKQAEADIEAAGKATPGPWEFEGDDPTDDELFTVCEDDSGREVRYGDVIAYVRGSWRTVANGRHMERHDPLTEAARAESVLAVLDLCMPVIGDGINFTIGEQYRAEDTVRLLAAGYRHREGYREPSPGDQDKLPVVGRLDRG